MVGPQAVVHGTLPLVKRTLVGFVGHMPTNPTNVAFRGALPLCSRTSGPQRRERRERPDRPTAATLFPSMMQLGRRAPPRAPAARPHRAPSASCCRPPAAAGPCSSSTDPRRRASWPRCRAGRASGRAGRWCQTAGLRDAPMTCPASRSASACVEVRERVRDSPERARSLLTVRAAISFARLVERPWSCSLSLMCSYCRSRLLLHAFCGTRSLLRRFEGRIPSRRDL